MSIASEVARLQEAKSGLSAALESKGVAVPEGTTLDHYPALVGQIPQIDPEDYYKKEDANRRFQMPIGYVFEWASVPEQSVDLSTPEKVAQYFGYGTWAAFGAGQFLLGVGGSYQAGNTGGEASHTLTRAELPNEKINVEVVFGGSSGASYYAVQNTRMVGSPPNSADAAFTKPLGSGQAHNNMPPYIVVYRWQRIA